MKKFWKKIFLTLIFFAIFFSILFTFSSWNFDRHNSIKYSNLPPLDLSGELKTAKVDLGKRIVYVRNGCVACHGTDLAGKVFIDGLPGRIAGANITPATLHEWSDEEIAQAIRNGVGKNHQPLKFMPSQDFQNLSKEDLASVIAFLRTVPPVQKVNTPIEIKPLGKILYMVGKFPNLFPIELIDAKKAFIQKPVEAPTVEFGKYIAKTSCMGCHQVNLAGGKIPGGPPEWPSAADLRPSAIGNWDEKNFITAMKKGINPSGKKIRPPMPIEMTSQMNEIELKALWSYLRSL